MMICCGAFLLLLSNYPLRAAEPAVTLASAAPGLAALLVDTNGPNRGTMDSWNLQRERLKQSWQQVLGEFPTRKVELNPRFLGTETLAGHTRHHIAYQVLEGTMVDGYLLVPHRIKGKAPAVVVFHPTTPFQARGVAGLEAAYPEDKRHGTQLVQKGFVVWCPRNYINTEGADWAGNARLVMAKYAGWTGMARMTWDAIRAMDFIESRPEVESSRIGCLGHSLGAKVVLYAMAFDPRYRAGVFSEGGIGLQLSNWEAPWYLGPKILASDFPGQHHEVLALIAPRAFLLIAGDSADTAESEQYIAAVRPVWNLYGSGERLRFINHRLGHTYPSQARWAAEDFLIRELAK